MPQIQDYSAPETQGQGPVGGLSPNLEVVSAPGRALQNIGSTLEQASDMFHRRDAAKETSDVYATFAKLRADWTNQLEEQSTNPDFDTQKFQQAYGDQVDALADKYNTAEGKDFFNKQAARLGGALLTRSSKIQMQQAGDQAKAELQTAINTDSATLMKDPTQFADAVDSGAEFIHAQASANPKLAGHEEMLKQYMSEQQAIAALKGYQNQNPGSFKDDEPGMGQKMLDSGEFDKYLKPQSRQNLENYFKASGRANDAQQAIQERAQQKYVKEQTENFGNQLLPKMMSGTFSPKDVLNAKMPDGTDYPPEFKMHMIDKAREYAKHEYDSNPTFKADVIRRMALDSNDPQAITDGGQILRMMGNGKLSPDDAGKFMTLLKKDPAQQEEMKADKTFLSSMTSQIRYKTYDAMGNQIYSPDGDTKLGQAMADYNKAKQDARAKGVPIADVRKDFDFEKYKTAPAERYTMQAALIKQQSATKAATPPVEMVDVIAKDGTPGKIPKANLEKAKLQGFKVK